MSGFPFPAILKFWNRRRAGPKVFGLGLSRTGTTSLNRALRHLGYRCRSYDQALLVAWRGGDLARLFAVTDKYEGFDDWPFPLAYREIMDRYAGDARYVLTVRKSSATWLESYIAHTDRTGPERAKYRKLTYGFPWPRGYEAEHLAFYDRHNAAIRNEVAARGLSNCFAELSWERGDGWAELCALTGHSVPDLPFPHANRRKPPRRKAA